MTEILESLKNPAWWFTVVVVGLFVNVIASYVKPQIDKLFSAYIESRRRTSARKQQVFENHVQSMLEDSTIVGWGHTRVSEQRIIMWGLLSAALISAFIAPLLLSAFFVIIAIQQQLIGVEISEELDEYYKRKRQME